jgi:hypothetical protein
MNKMNMPGFTAEASLSEIRKSYRAIGVASATTDFVLVPQLRRLGGGVSVPPKSVGPVYFKCGWNPKTLTSECTCSGDADCNRMFTSGFCGDNASCDTGTNTCRCDIKWS